MGKGEISSKTVLGGMETELPLRDWRRASKMESKYKKSKKKKIKFISRPKLKIPYKKFRVPKLNLFKKITFQGFVEWLTFPLFTAYDNFKTKRKIERLKVCKCCKILKIYFFHLFFNAIWSVIFFGFHNIGLALADLIIILLFIILLMKSYYKISKTSFYLMVPYLIWTSYAFILNTSIFLLN